MVGNLEMRAHNSCSWRIARGTRSSTWINTHSRSIDILFIHPKYLPITTSSHLKQQSLGYNRIFDLKWKCKIITRAWLILQLLKLCWFSFYSFSFESFFWKKITFVPWSEPSRWLNHNSNVNENIQMPSWNTLNGIRYSKSDPELKLNSIQ